MLMDSLQEAAHVAFFGIVPSGVHVRSALEQALVFLCVLLSPGMSCNH